METANSRGGRLLDWTMRQANLFGREAFVGQHRLHDHAEFGDEALLDLLEGHPRQRLQAFCSGTDPRRFNEDWHLVDVGAASPQQILTAVAKGRLWVNLQRIDESDKIGHLVHQLYEDLKQSCPAFRPFGIQASLFVSSPGAVVYYHADASPNLLWHLRGTKRIWVYPAQDDRLVPQSMLEDIFAGTVDEVPYSDAFDATARVFDLKPGDVASWPQNAPHRVCNLEGINVSLTSMHWTAESERRRIIYLSNRYFRRSLGLPARSTAERGVQVDIKCLVYRACNRLGLVSKRITASDSTYADRGSESVRFRIDSTAPSGIRPVRGGASGRGLTDSANAG